MWDYETMVIQENFDGSDYLPYVVLKREVYPISVTEAGRVPEF